MRLAALTGLYVAVVCSAQIGANKIVRLPFTPLDAPGRVYSIGIALALVQLAHHSGVTLRDGALSAQEIGSTSNFRKVLPMMISSPSFKPDLISVRVSSLGPTTTGVAMALPVRSRAVVPMRTT